MIRARATRIITRRTSTASLTTTLGNSTSTAGMGATKTARRFGGGRPLTSILRVTRNRVNYIMNCTG